MRYSWFLPDGRQRIVVIGVSGSGKTTLAGRIAQKLDIPHVELDALHWEPNWAEAPLDVMRARVKAATASDEWTLDGNYSKVRDITWPRARAIIWLDYSLPVVMWRIVTRSLRRAFRRQTLWNDNQESLQRLFSRDSIVLWALTTYKRRRRQYPQLFARPEYAHLTVIRHRSPAETERWLADLAERCSAKQADSVDRHGNGDK